jgi:hypothetical protein
MIIVPQPTFKLHFAHFVHAMEYYYLMWSRYYNTPNAATLIGIHDHPYVRDFIQHVQSFPNHIAFEPMNLQQALDSPSEKQVSNIINRGKQWFSSVESSRALRLSLYPREEDAALRIGIVNRSTVRATVNGTVRTSSHNRRLLNSAALKAALHARFGVTVDETTFDTFTFAEQTAFCNAHDIVISPHGAQLCSIPFMPERSLVVEVCHPDYYIDWYFSSLSAACGKSHFLACSTHDPERLVQDHGRRRCQDIECNVEAIVDSIADFNVRRSRYEPIFRKI